MTLVTIYFNRPIVIDARTLVELTGRLSSKCQFGVTLIHGIDGEFEDFIMDVIIERIRIHKQ